MGLELHIYDFDGTLFRSPETPEGWDNRWWISSESLNPPCVPLDPSGEWWVSKTVSAARASIANPDTYAVMMTGRPVRSGFRYRVPELLKSVGLKFDEVHLSDTNNTPAFKIKVIKNLLSKFPGVEKIVFWDDNAPYLARYIKLVEGYGYQAEANLVTVPAMECDQVPQMPESKKQAGGQGRAIRTAAAPDKYSHIDFKPPKSVADAAQKGLEFREKASPSNKGGLTPAEASKQGIGSGVQRAVNLKNRNNISPDVIRQMVAFFSRHEKNKSIAPENKSTPWNDKGHVAWMVWGGDPGKAWAEKVRNQMDAADKKAAVKKAMLHFASEVAEPPQILRTPHPATLVLRGVADLNQIAPMINRVLPRISLEPASIPKPKTAGKAYNFHWSNAQAAWDVIPVRDYPTTTDGSEFVLFIPKGVHNPVYEGPWTLRDMQVVARNLNPHPGYYGSMDSRRRS